MTRKRQRKRSRPDPRPETGDASVAPPATGTLAPAGAGTATPAPPETAEPPTAGPATSSTPATKDAPDSPRGSRVRAGLIGGAIVVLAALLAYSNAMPPVTVHDDAFFVPARHTLSMQSLAQMFSEDTWAATGSPAGTYRPLTLLSLAVDRALYGTDPAGYHATSVALHALASLLVYLFLLQALGAGTALLGSPAWPAALAAAIFAVHPIHTEAVDSAFNRSEILATIGVVGGLLAVHRWHERRAAVAWTVACVLYLAALLCRESAVTLPVLAALMLWLLHPGETPAARLRRVLPCAFLAIPLAEYFVLRQHGLADQVQAVVPTLGVDTGQELSSVLLYSVASLREYARMMVWPWPLRMSYEDFAGDGLAISLVVHSLLVAAAVAWRRSVPLASFAIAFFYASLLPSTRLFTSLGGLLQFGGEALIELKNSLLVGERVAYLPSVSLAIGLAVAFSVLTRRFGPRATGALAALPLALGLGVTIDRNRDWHSAVQLFAAEVQAAPENGDAWRLYVSALSNSGRFEEAATACDSQLDREARSAQLFNNCGVVYDRLQRDEEAIRSYRNAIDQGLEAVGHANLGRVYARLGRMAEAEAEYVAAAEAENDPARRHYRNGLRLARFHPDRLREARREFQAALALQPDYSAARKALAQMQRRPGR